MTAISFGSEEQWRELRAPHVGGSEVAALFGEHPQITHFELWHRKKGNLPEPDLSDNERVFWGTILEPAIAQGVAVKTGWQVRKVHRYYSARPRLALGGSLDYEIVAHDRGTGVLEIKTADWLIARKWESGPPLSYELQVQTYLGLTGRSWGCMAVLVGGNELRLFEYELRPKTIAIIEQRVSQFWQSIADNTPPAPNFREDAGTISALYGNAATGKVVDLTASNRLPELIGEYQSASAAHRDGEKAAKAAKAEIHMLLGDAEMAICGDYRIKASEVSGVPERVITEDMVGETIGGRRGYRGLWISTRKEKAA